MNLSHLFRFCACVALTWCQPAVADSGFPAPNWTVQEARTAAALIDTPAAVRPLFELARAGRDDALLESLAEVATRDGWTRPAREHVLYTFAAGLADLAPDTVGAKVMDWLLAYESRTLVPHDDHPAAGVPLYRVSAAAAGSLNAWERQTAAAESARLLQRGVQDWLGAYLAAGPARRMGLMDALDQAAPEQLSRLADSVLERLPAEPGLTPVAARAGVLLLEPAILGRAVAAGGGPGLAPELRSAARAFDELERAAVLRHAVTHAPPANASLAIAELAPGLLHQPEMTELLFAKLGDLDIGSAAALALSASKSQQVRDRLNELARGGTGLEASRAAIALGTSSNLTEEARR
jgi:hypothetical protein